MQLALQRDGFAAGDSFMVSLLISQFILKLDQSIEKWSAFNSCTPGV